MNFTRSVKTVTVYHIELTEHEGERLEAELATLDDAHGLHVDSILQLIFERLPTVRG